MLIAVDDQGNKVINEQEVIPDKLFCPHCKNGMSYVKEHNRQGSFVIPHFRHYVECPFSSEPESEEHIVMKSWMFDMLKPYFDTFDLEVRFDDRIADIYGIDKKGNKIAIECQNSIISESDIIERTESYTTKGIYVLWLLSDKNFLKLDNEGINTSCVERWLHKQNFGRVYYFMIDDHHSYGIIRNFNFQPIKRYVEEFYNSDTDIEGGGYHKFLKRKKRINEGSMPKYLGLVCFENNGFKLARFCDKKWWMSRNEQIAEEVDKIIRRRTS